MSIKDKIVLKFSRFINGSKASTSNIAVSKSVTSELVGYLANLSNFSTMEDDDIYEQLYVWEPEIGGAIDRSSTLVRNSFKGWVLNNVDEVLDPLEEEMLMVAKEIDEQQCLHNYIEMIAELYMMKGNVFIVENKDLSLSVLPSKYCTIVDDKKKIGNSSQNIMMIPKYLVFNEVAANEFDTHVYPMEEVYHIKYKDTPIFVKDSMGRDTYGYYSVSPLQRTVISVWWKRQCEMIDVLLRWRNVPREHHKINAEMFSLSNYAGKSPAERQRAAQEDIDAFIKKYIDSIADQMPDQGYVSTDNVEIGMIESKVNYLQSNELIKQLDGTITAGLNIPQSMINGQDAGSFASELVISNYVSAKIIQIAERIKPVILENMRKRLLAVNSSYPVEELDIKLELTLSNSKLETLREMAIMGSLGVFTENEIRNEGGWDNLRDDQRPYLVNSSTSTETAKSAVADASQQGGNTKNPDYPESSQSNAEHTRDAGENVLRNL